MQVPWARRGTQGYKVIQWDYRELWSLTLGVDDQNDGPSLCGRRVGMLDNYLRRYNVAAYPELPQTALHITQLVSASSFLAMASELLITSGEGAAAAFQVRTSTRWILAQPNY